MQIQDSQRLTFEMVTYKDAELLFQLDQDKEIMRYINGGIPSSRQEINDIFMPRIKRYTNLDKGWGVWKILLKPSNYFIGFILVRPLHFFSENPEFRNIELGWRLARKYWGKGYATEAVQVIKQALIIDSGEVDKLSAIAMEENKASINLMKKLGMKYLKTDIFKDPLGDEEIVYYELRVS